MVSTIKVCLFSIIAAILISHLSVLIYTWYDVYRGDEISDRWGYTIYACNIIWLLYTGCILIMSYIKMLGIQEDLDLCGDNGFSSMCWLWTRYNTFKFIAVILGITGMILSSIIWDRIDVFQYGFPSIVTIVYLLHILVGILGGTLYFLLRPICCKFVSENSSDSEIIKLRNQLRNQQNTIHELTKQYNVERGKNQQMEKCGRCRCYIENYNGPPPPYNPNYQAITV